MNAAVIVHCSNPACSATVDVPGGASAAEWDATGWVITYDGHNGFGYWCPRDADEARP